MSEAKEEYLTIKSGAEYLGISRDKLRRMIRDGEVPAVTNSLDKRERLIARSTLDKLKPAGQVIRTLDNLA